MSTIDTRLSVLLEQFIGDLQSPYEDIRRRATDELYERIIVQYADVSWEIFAIEIEENIIYIGTNRCGYKYCRTNTRICSKKID